MRRIQNKNLPLLLSAVAILLLLCMFLSLSEAGTGWTSGEKAVIGDGTAVMRVLTIEDKADSLFLRTPCKELTRKQIRSKEYATLVERMLVTVTSPDRQAWRAGAGSGRLPVSPRTARRSPALAGHRHSICLARDGQGHVRDRQGLHRRHFPARD